MAHRDLRRIFPAIGPRFVVCELEGVSLLCDLTERKGPGRTVVKYGHHDPYPTRLMKSFIAPDRGVIDVGANMGVVSLIASRASSGPVYAFEPDPFLFALLEHNIARNGAKNVQAFALAASDAAGELRLYRNAANQGDGRCFDSGDDRDSVAIRAERIDDVLPDIDLERLALIKIDVQGFELHAVRGMRRILEDAPSVKVITEFEAGTLRRAGSEPGAYLDFYEELGFRWRLIDEQAGCLREVDRRALEGGTLNLLVERP